MLPMHHETGHGADGTIRRDCACTIGLDHDRNGYLAEPPTIAGREAAICSACGRPQDPPRFKRRRRPASATVRPMTTDTSGADRPGANATKAELVDYATTRGIDRTEAENLTKDQINERLDQAEQAGQQQAPATPDPTVQPGMPGALG